ncbi:MAG: radical SAM protein [Tannerellaceae bacterium]|nr:radical SAM protein [Tannerellaceae bacterium]
MIKVRAEEQALMLWNRATGRTAILSGSELEILAGWLNGSKETGFIRRLRKLALLPEDEPHQILHILNESSRKKAPFRSLAAPESLHIELTSCCPLQCQQCYKEHGEQELAGGVLHNLIRQAEKAAVFQIALGGGEPLLYPDLPDVIAAITGRGMAATITTSGVGLTREKIARLTAAGINHIQVSLNGSTEEVNKQSRDGYKEACRALGLLAGTTLSYGINWVARMDNIDDFPQLVQLGHSYRVNNINILRYKPSVSENYQQITLTKEKQLQLAGMVKEVRNIRLKTDSAYSSLLCYLNNRSGLFTGCGAGRRFMAIDATGNFRPCSHTAMTHPGNNMMDYWYNSSHLALFRHTEENQAGACKNCFYLSGCRGCQATGEENCAFRSPLR